MTVLFKPFLTADWTPSLWLDVFDELLLDDTELNYGDSWSLNFNYSQDDTVTKEERKRGWKVYCHCGFGKYVLLFVLIFTPGNIKTAVL